MLFKEPALYLPIAQRTVQALLSATSLEGMPLNNDELAAAITIQYLPRLYAENQPISAAERVLANAIELAAERAKRNSAVALVEEFARFFNKEVFTAGINLLDTLQIVLLTQEEIDCRSYLDYERKWDYTFTRRHSNKQKAREVFDIPVSGGRIIHLPEAQIRVMQMMQGDLADHLHVQGYAGSGKTHLLSVIIELLESRGVEHDQILVLTYTPQQRAALEARLPRTVPVRTFGRLVEEMIPLDGTNREYRTIRRVSPTNEQFDPQAYVNYTAITSVGPISPPKVAQVCFDTVRRFCSTSDPEITTEHLPRWIDERTSSNITSEAKEALVAHAVQLWHDLITQPIRNVIPIRRYHQIKYIALHGWGIPLSYLHVIIDESHDLTKPIVQILDQSPQAVFSLGDEYQSLSGRSPQRSRTVLQTEVTRSIRNGPIVASVVNPIILTHPESKTKELFVGNRHVKTTVKYYSKASVPDLPAAILVSDEWGLFEWANRLADAGVQYSLLTRFDELLQFVQDCIELHKHPTRPRHGKIYRYGSWSEVFQACRTSSAFLYTHERLEKRYTTSDWERVADRIRAGANYVLGRIADARNMEFDRVMLTPDVMDLAWEESREAFIKTGTSCYIGSTRARFELLAPESLRQWTEDISGRRA